jgi:aminocarboxymuconate-semialdehyde decarboxylase
MTVVDIHTHMISKEWLELLERESGTFVVADAPGGARAIYRGSTPFMTLTGPMSDYGLRLEAMDKAGVDVAVVSLTCPSVYWGAEETSVRAARLINDQMAEAQGAHPDRIRYLATLPWQHPSRAVEELERACGLGAVGVMVLANIDGESLTEARFEPVWEAIDRRALPVLVHPATPPGLEHLDIDRFHLVWSVGFPMDTTLALARMIMDGFFDRYRHLKIIGSHAAGCLPFLLGRLDAGPRFFAAAREKLSVAPATFASRIYADAITYSPAALKLTIDTFGPDNVLYGSDFPHMCGRMDEMLDLVDTLQPTEVKRVRATNAERIFAL